jgi:hypothetical protein
MTRQWVRVTSGKGAGRVGYILWENGIVARIIFPGASYPKDEAYKRASMFVRLTEAECAAMEMRG